MSKRNMIIYWIATIWLSLGMTATGLQQLLKAKVEGSVAPPGTDGIVLLGYPIYMLTLLGIAKLLGVIAILIPNLPLLKEWAYAGFFFIMAGAIYSHIALGHTFSENFPALILLVLTGISWYFRPANRKISIVNS